MAFGNISCIILDRLPPGVEHMLCRSHFRSSSFDPLVLLFDPNRLFIKGFYDLSALSIDSTPAFYFPLPLKCSKFYLPFVQHIHMHIVSKNIKDNIKNIDKN